VTELTLFDQDLRGLLTRMIAERGHAPSIAELATAAGAGAGAVEESLRRLHESHSLLLHPHRCEPWVVHPFALSAGGCWVETPARGYWANCLYCGLGIAAALSSDAVITTRLGGEGETVRYHVEGRHLVETEGVFHLSVPAARWWDNVIFACASFQPFASEADVDPWCARHGMPRGAVMSLEPLWRFAGDWYGGCLDQSWRKRSVEQVRALFAAHGLTDPFWEIALRSRGSNR
jgi:alkylmercury lyase-like protein